MLSNTPSHWKSSTNILPLALNSLLHSTPSESFHGCDISLLHIALGVYPPSRPPLFFHWIAFTSCTTFTLRTSVSLNPLDFRPLLLGLNSIELLVAFVPQQLPLSLRLRLRLLSDSNESTIEPLPPCLPACHCDSFQFERVHDRTNVCTAFLPTIAFKLVCESETSSSISELSHASTSNQVNHKLNKLCSIHTSPCALLMTFETETATSIAPKVFEQLALIPSEENTYCNALR